MYNLYNVENGSNRLAPNRSVKQEMKICFTVFFLPTVIKWPELQKSRQVFIYLILFSSTTVWYSTCKWAEETKSVLISQYFTPSERHTHTSLGDINRLSCSEFALLLSFLRENCLLISWVALNTLYVHNRCSDCSEDAFIYLLPIIATIIYFHKNSLNDPQHSRYWTTVSLHISKGTKTNHYGYVEKF